ncbi:hypothetical protein [Helicobacter sp. T3_23-1056]
MAIYKRILSYLSESKYLKKTIDCHDSTLRAETHNDKMSFSK